MKFLLAIAAASAVRVMNDPNLNTYDDRTHLTGHYPGEGAAPFGDGFPIDYFVPNFGVDSDVSSVAQSVDEAETELKHKPVWGAAPPAPHPVDYFVPNFGVDHEILSMQQNLKMAEESTEHKWEWKDLRREIPAVAPWWNSAASTELDPEIADTNVSLNQA